MSLHHKTLSKEKTSYSTASVLDGHLEKAVGIGEVAVGMAALVEPLQQSRDAVPLGPFISLLEQPAWELRHTNRGNYKHSKVSVHV